MDNKKNNKILFSIILPVYNSEKYLVRCVDSVLSQDYENFELLIVDDGSTDNSPQICDEIASNSKDKVQVFHQQNNGCASARNKALAQAKGDYVLFVDADDEIKNNATQSLYEIIANNKDLDMVIFCADTIGNNNYKLDLKLKIDNKKIDEGFYKKSEIENDFFPELYKFGNFHYTLWRCCFKRDLIVKHHTKKENLVLGSDQISCLESLYYSDRLYFSDKSLYIYNEANKNSLVHSDVCTYSYINRINKSITDSLYNKSKKINKYLASMLVQQYIKIVISFYYEYKNISKNKNKYTLLDKNNKFKIFKEAKIQKNTKNLSFSDTTIGINSKDLDSWWKKVMFYCMKNEHFILSSFLIKSYVLLFNLKAL